MRITSENFGLAPLKAEGTVSITVNGNQFIFHVSELEFLNSIPRLSKKSKEIIIKNICSLIDSKSIT